MTYIDLQTRAALVTLHSEKHRHYHTLDHVYDCLSKLETYAHDTKQHYDSFSIVETAIWFHDAVYNPRSKANEENSVELFMSVFGSKHDLSHKTLGQICGCIIGTKTHNPFSEEDKIMCDIDLSILGAERKCYAQYQYDVWKEYNFVPHDKFIIGRSAFLNGMLKKADIFSLPYFKNLYEKQARENMEWELTILK